MKRFRIDIGSVLKKFDDLVDEARNEVKTYGIRFIKSDGTVREIINARKNVKDPKRQLIRKAHKNSRSMYNLKFHGVMLVYDDDNDAFRSIKVAQLFQFRDYNSDRWLDIFH